MIHHNQQCIRKRSIMEYCKYPKRLALAAALFFLGIGLMLYAVFNL